jgi:hypothetical protein
MARLHGVLLAVCGVGLAAVFIVSAAPAGGAPTTTTAPPATTTTTAPPPTTTTTAPEPPLTGAASLAWHRAIATEAALGSVHIKGSIHQGSEVIDFTLLVNGDGEGGGTFAEEGSTFQLERVATMIYFNASKRFWTAHGSTSQAAKFAGKWIQVSALNSQFASFDQFLNAGDLASSVFRGYTAPLSMKRTRWHGRRVERISDQTTGTSSSAASAAAMYVAAQGRPYVVAITYHTPSETGSINFSRYGRAVSISVPPEPISLG